MSFDPTNRYDLTDLPDPVVTFTDPRAVAAMLKADTLTPADVDAYLWSKPAPPPAIGDPVTIKINGLGDGTVAAYFVEHGWLGLKVKLANPPDWHVAQTKNHKYAGYALVFGAEVA